MKRENDEITDLFRSRLEHAEMPVRESLWESLEKEIPAAIHRRNRHFIYRFSAAASILLVLMGSSAAFWYFSPKEEIADAFTQMAITTTPPKGSISADVVKTELPVISETPVKPKPAPANKKKEANGTIQQEETISMSFSMSFSFSATGQVAENTRPGQNRQASYTDESTQASPEAEEVQPEAAKTKTQDNKKRWALGISASTALKESDGGIDHKMPLSLGLTVKKELSPRVALESGITYTQLNSDFDAEGITSSQKLHYIGIPLKANVSLYKTDRINLYALGGGMIEKCVSGGSDAFQASLITGAGLEYKLNKHLSLYTEPALSYHFDDGSSMNTLRSEKPLNVNLLCGVRMTY